MFMESAAECDWNMHHPVVIRGQVLKYRKTKVPRFTVKEG
jgi:hypothetical protein